MKQIAKLILGNLLILVAIVSVASLTLRFGRFLFASKVVKESDYTANTIRSTYPNYAHLKSEEALGIFTGYAGPSSSYNDFIGWRRDPYDDEVVTIEPTWGSRVSTGHSTEDAIWFFGGSTMWGTGSGNESTIPSYYSQRTGRSVWNLGESGFLSFQELVELNKMLARGLIPRAVVFYDGVNDPYIYCDQKNLVLPVHSHSTRYKTYISEYGALKRELDKVKKYNVSKLHPAAVVDAFEDTFEYMADPFLDQFTSVNTNLGIDEYLATDKPFSEFAPVNEYLVCGNRTERAREAATMTVRTWLLAYDVLSAIGVEAYFFLQPTSHIGTDSYQLDYLINLKKQAIADERRSYEAFYEALPAIWRELCVAHDACDQFTDLRHAFLDFREPLFIDTVHVSPPGNKIIADMMAEVIEGRWGSGP